MIELELLGTSADGESLVLTDAQGERYSVLISDELRGATRRDRPRVELAPARPTLAPRDIQALLRAGATPAEIASQHGMEVSAVERFEAPVQAEKDYALTRARAVRIGDGGPTMGDLVLDRLAARGVDPSSLEWTATREAGEPWQIIVTFVQGAAEHAAHWHLSNSGSLEAIDQEAQWLTEQVSASPTASIFTPMPRTAPAPVVDPGAEDLRNREAIIDQLNAVRGKRQQIDLDLDDEVDGHEPHSEGGGPDETGTRIQKNADQEYPDPLEQIQLHRGFVPQMALDGTIPVLPSPSHHAMLPAGAATIAPPMTHPDPHQPSRITAGIATTLGTHPHGSPALRSYACAVAQAFVRKASVPVGKTSGRP